MRNTATIGVQAFTKAKAMFTSFVIKRHRHKATNDTTSSKSKGQTRQKSDKQIK